MKAAKPKIAKPMKEVVTVCKSIALSASTKWMVELNQVEVKLVLS